MIIGFVLIKTLPGYEQRVYDKLYKVSEVQVSVFSASSFEAVVAGVPIILVDPEDFYKTDDFFQRKVELRATNLEELDFSLTTVLSPGYSEEFRVKREKYLKDMIGWIDGKAHKRVADTIIKIINGEKSS